MPYQFQSLGGCKRRYTIVVVCFLLTVQNTYAFRYGDLGNSHTLRRKEPLGSRGPLNYRIIEFIVGVFGKA